MKNELIFQLKKVLEDLGLADIKPAVEYPADPKHGDYSTNVAMVAFGKYKGASIKGQVYKSPLELANEIVKILNSELLIHNSYSRIEAVAPGFINFWITNDALVSSLTQFDNVNKLETSLTGKKVLVEFAHPNTHKAFHIGHLRNIIIGKSIVRLLETTGVSVIRGNYQGDVGMHIAKALYALLQNSEFRIQNSELDERERVDLLAKAYAAGSKAFEEDPSAKQEILEINKKIYARDPSIWELYQETRQWSLDYFELIYKRLGVHFDRYYFESEVYESGFKNVMEGLQNGIFEKSNGAIIFPGKKFGLHDRVFITGEGNPTYEAKDIGLAPLQFSEHNLDLVIHVVGSEQSDYFKVVFEALAQLIPETRGKEQHLVYGWVKLKEGKMSSRSGQVVLGEYLLDEAKKEILQIINKNESGYSVQEKDEIAEKVAVGAVKYSFLKVSTQQEIVFDLKESISFEGNSGPYIQYVFARTQSVLARVENGELRMESFKNLKLESEERELLRLLVKYDEVIIDAASKFAPNILCVYLFELSQSFNLFYQKCPIIKAEGEMRDFRLFLTQKTGETIKNGLKLLGIEAPIKM